MESGCPLTSVGEYVADILLRGQDHRRAANPAGVDLSNDPRWIISSDRDTAATVFRARAGWAFVAVCALSGCDPAPACTGMNDRHAEGSFSPARRLVPWADVQELGTAIALCRHAGYFLHPPVQSSSMVRRNGSAPEGM